VPEVVTSKALSLAQLRETYPLVPGSSMDCDSVKVPQLAIIAPAAGFLIVVDGTVWVVKTVTA